MAANCFIASADPALWRGSPEIEHCGGYPSKDQHDPERRGDRDLVGFGLGAECRGICRGVRAWARARAGRWHLAPLQIFVRVDLHEPPVCDRAALSCPPVLDCDAAAGYVAVAGRAFQVAVVKGAAAVCRPLKRVVREWIFSDAVTLALVGDARVTADRN